MGKQGPCRHCGVTSTPLWRNGPPEKPVLCNACGSRWRTKGSLANYTPMHRRDDIDDEEPRVSKLRPPTSKPKPQKAKKMQNHWDDIDDEEPRISKVRPPTSNPKVQKAKKMPNNTVMESGPFSGQDHRWLVDADPSNRSSSGSAVSYSESCAPYGAPDASEMTVSDQSHAWESLVPSKKRSCINRPKASAVEKLAKDLNSIMHEEQLYYLSGSSEEDLLYHSETPVGSFEIGSGSVLLRNPRSKSLEEESEASSIPAENKSYITSESYSGSGSFVVHSGSKEASYLNAAIERPKRSRLQIEDSVRRDSLDYENQHILESADSPLISVDLEDVINYTNFVKYLSEEDQQQLLKFLPPIDFSTPPESFRSMFSSIQFADAIHSYQRLLGEGILDPSLSIDEEWNAVKRLALTDLTKCNWVECYIKQKEKVIEETGEEKSVSGSKGIAMPAMKSLKRPRGSHFESCAELDATMRSSKRVGELGALSSQFRSSSLPKSGYATKDLACTGGALNLFMIPPEELSSLVPPLFTDKDSDQDLLLDIPLNARHPEAELLYQPSQLSSVIHSSTSMGRGAEGEMRTNQ